MKKFLILALVVAAMFAIAVPVFGNGPIHKVTIGTPDVCEAFGFPSPGCDANFSLVALEFANGSVRGQYTDRFANGQGFHATIDCLVVDGNQAWVSGVVTTGYVEFLGGDITGFPVATRLVDNGTSANDAVDQITFSWLGDSTPCTDMVDYPLFDAPDGQVNVD